MIVKSYTLHDKMSDMICDNYSLLQVMSRFNLPLGFGDLSVEEVCKAHQVDASTFLSVVNYVNAGAPHVNAGKEGLSLQELMNYLKRAHHYYLEFQLPSIRRKLIEAIDCSSENEISFLIIKFFDAYVKEVRKHMGYEDMNVFKYVEDLMEGKMNNEYSIDMFVRRHDQVDDKLTELKNIIIKYYPPNKNSYLMNAVLFDIYNCEKDLVTHNNIEDHLFVPAVVTLEKKVAKMVLDQVENVQESSPDTGKGFPEGGNASDGLSQREKEIVCCIVKGMSNKEIANHLFISIHTVITHRRNISRKLQLHSPTLLTVYAIVNKLVDISEVKI